MTGNAVVLAIVAATVMAALSVTYIVMTMTAQRQRQRRAAAIADRWRYQSGEMPELRRDGADSSMRSFDRLIKMVLPRPKVLRQRLARTGMKISIGEFILASTFLGLSGMFVAAGIIHTTIFVAAMIGLVCAFGFPHAIIKLMTKRRQKKFIGQFPDAIDLIVRGLKSGLPVTESIKVVAQEIDKPVGEEFQLIVDKLGVGETLEQALWDVAARIDTPEIKFFVVALSVQRETGGNLAETLENLSDVLRKRRQMKMKIKALASEPKASAMILGALPFIMFALISAVNSEYTTVLITDPRGHKLIAIGLTSQLIGILVMVKMVNFEI